MGNLKRMNFEDFPKHVNFDWGLGTHNFEKIYLIISNMPTSLVIQKYSSIPNSLVKILLLQFLVPYSVKLDKTPMALHIT